MTNVIFRELPDSGAIEMRVQGHVGFDVAGKDLVCAGASTLALTVAQCIEAMKGKMHKEPNIVVKSGTVRVVAKPEPEYYGETMHVFAVGQVGFRLLAESFPDHITLTPFRTPARAE